MNYSLLINMDDNVTSINNSVKGLCGIQAVLIAIEYQRIQSSLASKLDHAQLTKANASSQGCRFVLGCLHYVHCAEKLYAG